MEETESLPVVVTKKRIGKPPYEPGPEQRNLVAIASASGMKQEDIAKALGIDKKTLRKHFREELDEGHAKVLASIKMTAYQMALSGNQPAMTMFILKTQCGWREVERQQVQIVDGEGKDVQPAAPRPSVLIVPRIPTVDEWTMVTSAAQAELLKRASSLVEAAESVVDVQ
jgi:DNA-binding XRE family transcriptional regulator